NRRWTKQGRRSRRQKFLRSTWTGNFTPKARQRCPCSITVCFTATEFLRAFVFTTAAFSGWKNISSVCGTRRARSVCKSRCPSALNPAVKSLNYLNNVMARIEANQANADEALMLNDEGNVAECTADNVFIVKHGQIFTPPITAGALRGITRSVVFEIAAETGI